MKTLAIMAAGLGSRYGGLKQLDSIDADGYSIIDYSIYDATKVGFNDIVLIIRRELHDSFVKRFSHLNSKSLKISYVFQETSDVPKEFTNTLREKPWGTGHAFLALQHTVKNNFALINADDFYGRDAFQVMYKELFSSENKQSYFMVGYKLKNTLSPFGTVSRGECYIDKNNSLQKVVERTNIEQKGKNIQYINEKETKVLSENTLVSMNFWGFTPSIFEHGNQMFREFLENNYNNPKIEFFVPSIVNTLINNYSVSVKVLATNSNWHGITYKEDKAQIVDAISQMKASSIYPKKLWKENNILSVFYTFNHWDIYKKHTPLTSGHINDTFLVETTSNKSYVLQKLNTKVFNNIDALVANKVDTSHYYNKKSNYNSAVYIQTLDKNYVSTDFKGESWTLCNYIKNTNVFLTPKNVEMAYQAGLMLGDFHKSMSGYAIETLFEVIPDFHNLTSRIHQYYSALKNANNSTIIKAKKEIELIDLYKENALHLHQLKESNRIPLRVTHNDAKLSNMLFSEKTLNAIAMIDFDTIMPGIIHYDIGDALRSICSISKEDESDISKIAFNIEYYKAFMKGFLEMMLTKLTKTEKKTLPLSIKYMLYEQSLRFLTDYLNGNTYYKVDYPEHNLVRTKNQLTLLKKINENFEEIEAITNSLLSSK